MDDVGKVSAREYCQFVHFAQTAMPVIPVYKSISLSLGGKRLVEVYTTRTR